MDDHPGRPLEYPPGERRPRLSRRRFLGLAGAAGGLGGAGWLSRWRGRSAAPSGPSFELRSAWRETLPGADWSSANRLPLLEEPFEKPATLDRWEAHRLEGPAPATAIGGTA